MIQTHLALLPSSNIYRQIAFISFLSIMTWLALVMIVRIERYQNAKIIHRGGPRMMSHPTVSHPLLAPSHPSPFLNHSLQSPRWRRPIRNTLIRTHRQRRLLRNNRTPRLRRRTRVEIRRQRNTLIRRDRILRGWGARIPSATGAAHAVG